MRSDPCPQVGVAAGAGGSGEPLGEAGGPARPQVQAGEGRRGHSVVFKNFYFKNFFFKNFNWGKKKHGVLSKSDITSVKLSHGKNTFSTRKPKLTPGEVPNFKEF